MIDRLGSILLEVADLERSIAFYRDGLRFRLEAREAGADAGASLRAGGVQLTLVPAPARRGARRGCGISLLVEVSGVDAYYEALVARGLLPSPPADADRSRRFTVRDPDGYIWTFVQSLA